MPRKKSVVEVIPPGAPDPKPAKMKTVAAKHTITYEAPVDVPVVEDETDPDDPSLDDGDPEEIEEQPRYRPPSFRMKLKQKFQQRGIGGDETLTLRIDRLPNFEMNGLAGVKADKEFCGIITCTEKFFDHDEYLIEIQRRYGPGEYWLTVRHKNSIMNSWRERIGGFPAPAPATSETGQSNPQGFQPMPNQPVGTIDPLAQLRSAFKMVREFKADLGIEATQPPAPPPDPEVVLLQNLANNDKFMDKVTNGLVGKVLGKSAVEEETSWAAVGMEAVKSGQVAVAIDALGKVALSLVDRIFPRGANDGQAQMGVPPQPPVQQPQGQTWQGQPQGQTLEQGHQGALPPGGQRQTGDVQTEQGQAPTNMQTSPENQALNEIFNYVVGECAKQTPVGLVAEGIDTFIEQRVHPFYQATIDAQLSAIAVMPVERVIDYVKGIPGGEKVTSLPHAKEWTEALQRLIRESQEGESEE